MKNHSINSEAPELVQSLTKKIALERLNTFYLEQFKTPSEGFSWFGRALRFLFGWYQDSRIKEFKKYLAGLQDNDIVKPQAIEAINNSAAVQHRDEALTNFLDSMADRQKANVNQPEADENYVSPDYIKTDPTADLTQFPGDLIVHDNLPNSLTQLTIGDLHANAMKLIYFLVREGILIGLNAEDYHQLTRIYQTPIEQVSAEDLTKFNALIAKTTLNPKGVAKIRLLGDVLADRGMCDYYTLIVLAHLKKLGASLEILLSNHDAEFLNCYVPDLVQFENSNLAAERVRSMTNLELLMRNFPEHRQTITHIIEETYKPALNLIAYSLSPDGKHITIYTHAPVGLETIQELAQRLGVEFHMSTAKRLAKTIDAINEAAHHSHDAYTGLKGMLFQAIQSLRKEATLQNPIYRLIWASYGEVLRPTQFSSPKHPNKGYSLSFVHGHTYTPDFAGVDSHIHNLDSDFGKDDASRGGNYIVHRIEVTATATADNHVVMRSPGGNSTSSSPTTSRSPESPAIDLTQREATRNAADDSDEGESDGDLRKPPI